MKCCHYERHLTNINGTFTVTSSIWLRPSSFLFHSFILRRSHLLPDQLPGEHTDLPPHVGQCLPLSAFRSLHLQISHTHTHTHSCLVGRSMVAGYIPMVHMCSLMCTNHIDMTAHTPASFTQSGTTCIYMEHGTAGHSLISHLWSNASRTVTHPCINKAHDCLTSAIKLNFSNEA